ncbi:DNA strand exchange inhibitor protein [Sutcliffiella horikoshii]|uniref:DNA strand exchange inhibitor protein n=1 Tax=Sutcliffiella horikoshii TaxID=79883 RepID=UPI002041E8C8|nr:DNA strand exchange inhibitor protein [Sutcliffiella horikoshii]MCM3619184.1 DNA strand exchange inhibitor protein [Sutcliffiella horikoshii]
MSGIYTKLSYKQLQTIKHALKVYMQRNHITEEEKSSEEALLHKVETQIETMRERYNF